MKDSYTIAMMAILIEVIVFRLFVSLPFIFYYLLKVAPNSNEPYYLQDEYNYSVFRYL
jgi:hypothetical protein